MNGRLVTALVIGIVAGCGSSTPTASPVPVARPGATAAPRSVQPSLAVKAAPRPFPTQAFAGLPDTGVPEDVAAKFQAALASLLRDGGIAATVMTPEGTWSGAVGTADGVHDLEVDSQFGIASVTKPIVAAQVMRMVEAGEISLDAPATDYLPADLGFDTNGATVRQLLSHRSGIPDFYTDAWQERMVAERNRVWQPEEVLALVDPARKPLDTYAYSDTNYVLLGLVIEHVRGRPLGEVLRGDVLDVEGTDRLIYQPAEAPSKPMAMPRAESRAALEKGGGYLPSIADASSDGPAGSGASDTPSLARWWRAFCAGEVVSQASLDEMATLYDNDEVDYGLGLFNPAAGYAQGVGHMGASFGYNAWAACLSEDRMVVVVLTNADSDIFNLGKPLVIAARPG
jgi:D-alanyl-D-alanine carboxypeptidase